MSADTSGVPPTTTPSGGDTPAVTIGVVLASAGRPELLAQALLTCNSQRDVQFTGVVSVPDEHSLPTDRSTLAGWTVISLARGLTAQRNKGITVLPDTDLVAFFDDDAVVREDYLANAAAFFAAHPEVVGITGRVLIDGAASAEVSTDVANQALAESAEEPLRGSWHPSRELYGCNFVVRGDHLRAEMFDERLPLYSWLEDHDLARRLMKRGMLAKVDDCVIVHRAAASGGRQNHVRLGYSQVMNPIYLNRKGVFPVWLVLHEIVPRTAKNVVLSVVANSERDWRRRRVLGNFKAWSDVVRGRITPERILEL